MLSRRLFLQGLVGAAVIARSARLSRAQEAATRVFSPVNVDPARVTRTLVGLRPYRPSGFVVRAEPLGEKTIVHNYGHGGAGITLSWGTSELAVELAWPTGCRNFAVLGCGVVGLSTARLLQQRGATVTVYARDLPPATTSNIAGGQWGAAMVADDDKRTPEWNQQLKQASQSSHRTFQDLLGDDYGVRWMQNYLLSAQSPRPSRSDPIDAHLFSLEDSPFEGYFARRFTTMMIEPALYLRRLTEDVLRFGGRIVVRTFPDRQSLQALPEKVLLNCTGLGSRALFGDEELIPVRGQLCVLLPQAEVDYAVVGPGDLYMFPRKDGIILGGTHERNNWSLKPSEEVSRNLLEGHSRLFKTLKSSGGPRP